MNCLRLTTHSHATPGGGGWCGCSRDAPGAVRLGARLGARPRWPHSPASRRSSSRAEGGRDEGATNLSGASPLAGASTPPRVTHVPEGPSLSCKPSTRGLCEDRPGGDGARPRAEGAARLTRSRGGPRRGHKTLPRTRRPTPQAHGPPCVMGRAAQARVGRSTRLFSSPFSLPDSAPRRRHVLQTRAAPHSASDLASPVASPPSFETCFSLTQPAGPSFRRPFFRLRHAWRLDGRIGQKQKKMDL